MNTPMYRIWDRKLRKYIQDDVWVNAAGQWVTQRLKYAGYGKDDLIIERCTGFRDIGQNFLYDGDVCWHNFPCFGLTSSACLSRIIWKDGGFIMEAMVQNGYFWHKTCDLLWLMEHSSSDIRSAGTIHDLAYR